MRARLLLIPFIFSVPAYGQDLSLIHILGAQPVSVQLSHDREGDGRFHDGADALGAWGRRIPLRCV